MLVSGRFVLSGTWSEGTGGRYYWQHCVYVDTDDFENDEQMGLAVVNDMGLLYTNQIRFHGLRWFIPGTETIYFSQTYTFPLFGSRPAVETPNILVCARWRMFGADGSYSYHLHRQPIGADYLENGEWSAVGGVQNALRLSTFIGQGIYRTKTGSLITAGHVASYPVPWQLRHGTKRRERRAWL